jgi:hypothetical protein
MLYRITHSLLSAFDYATSEDATENNWDSFMQTLLREPFVPTAAMEKGIAFEAEVSHYAKTGFLRDGLDVPKAEKETIFRFGNILYGATQQVRAEKQICVNGLDVLLVGVADFVKAGIIYDTKRVTRYEYGKYSLSSQHPMYFELFPEAREFQYLIWDGYIAYTETYHRGEYIPIEVTIAEFLQALESLELLDVYKKNWMEEE